MMTKSIRVSALGLFLSIFAMISFFSVAYASITVIATIQVGMGPRRLAYDSANQNIYVANFNSDSVSVIDGRTNSVATSIQLPRFSRPFWLAFDPANQNIYVANTGMNDVSVIKGSTNAVITTIAFPSGANIATVAYDPA